MVVDDTGKVIYNIQIKSTMSGKNFELALNRLSLLITRIIKKTEAGLFKTDFCTFTDYTGCSRPFDCR